MSDRYIPEPLKSIAQQVENGEHPQCAVRTILSWYGYQRRGFYVVRSIDDDLLHLKLGTLPHFDWTYLDGPVTFMPRGEAIVKHPVAYRKELSTEVASSGQVPQVENVTHSVDATISGAGTITADASIKRGDGAAQTPLDPTYRIGRLDMANRPPLSVAPETTVREAVTIMLKHHYSQLPVMIGERSVKGLFSWKSYGARRSMGRDCACVKEAMDDCRTVSVDDSIFHIVEAMQDDDCVLIRDSTDVVTGIVTLYDIGVTFGQLGEPFLVLGEIENHIRALIEGRFTQEELAQARDSGDDDRKIERVADLTFGEYVRLLENPARWERLGLTLDRITFVKDLEEVRRIRNDVAHFDPEGIDEPPSKRGLKTLKAVVDTGVPRERKRMAPADHFGTSESRAGSAEETVSTTSLH